MPAVVINEVDVIAPPPPPEQKNQAPAAAKPPGPTPEDLWAALRKQASRRKRLEAR